ncbi:MAG: methionine--tRNA ligase, partial [Verrucomicrobia bacterium]|nr:methionine--tRNA ligase [Verrucomicrobiota bacterium]
ALARYHRLTGGETRLQTGTDENALKNVLAARAEGITPEELVARNADAFRALAEALNVRADRFIRTTEEKHRAGVHWFWRRLRADDLYRQSYKGLYCSGCEDFYLEKELRDGRCPIHGREAVAVEEENWFFRLSAYQRQIEDLLESGRVRVLPEARRNEVLSFVRSGLRDFSVTRNARRAYGWGIRVPDDPDQVIYVWLDALTNYLTGLGYGGAEEDARFWSGGTLKVHVLGKDVWKFHAVYWPAFLLSAGLPLPNTILVHGFLTVNGQKIGKSLGNAVDPATYIGKYGADGLRYYLLRAIPPFDDGDFSTDALHRLYHADLANGIGNLASRVCALGEKTGYGRFEIAETPAAPAGYHEALAEYRGDLALKSLWNGVDSLNQAIERARPWERAGEPGALRPELTQWLGELHGIGYWLQPFLPATAERLLGLLSADAIRRCPPLFPRVG